MKYKNTSEGWECLECGNMFETKRGVGVHYGHIHSKELEGYRNEEVLKRMYFEENMSVPDIAKHFDVSSETIYTVMENRNIKRDPTRWGFKNDVGRATYYLDDCGYPRWQSKHRRKNGDRVTYNYHVHRLLAVSEFGVDAVKGKVVHHRNEIPWDNRPDNIELLTRSEHRSLHNNEDKDSMVIV